MVCLGRKNRSYSLVDVLYNLIFFFGIIVSASVEKPLSTNSYFMNHQNCRFQQENPEKKHTVLFVKTINDGHDR
jgi:hypothetical protein